MWFFKILLSGYYRVGIFIFYSLIFFGLILMFPVYSHIFFLIYSFTIMFFVIFYNFFLSLGKNILSSFVEIVFNRMYGIMSKLEFFAVIKDIFKVLGVNVSNLMVFVDLGKGYYELIGSDDRNISISTLSESEVGLHKYIETSKVRIPFVDINNTTLLPRSIFENTRVLLDRLKVNILIPIYSPNFQLIGLVLFYSSNVKFKNMFYLSQFINIVALMFKTINDTEKKKVLEEDIKIASQIQNKLIPTDYISNKWFESYGVYIPAYNIGGDYLDIIKRGNNFSFAVGDVSGKGISAGLVSMMVKAILNTSDITSKTLVKVVRNVNYYIFRWFYDQENILTFLTLFLGVYVPDKSRLFYVNAGHVPCMLVKNKEVISLSASVRPLGLFEKIHIERKEIEVESGDILVLYTDGLIEQIDKRGREFGINRLREILLEIRMFEPRDMVEFILRRLREFSKEELDDDVCILVVKFR